MQTVVNIRNFLNKWCIIFFSKIISMKRKVVFVSFGGRQYSDNPRALSEKLHELSPDIRIVWRLLDKRDRNIPPYIKVVYGRGFWSKIKYAYELASTSVFVTNNEIRSNIYKRDGQFFIQTWHGDRGFKKVLRDADSNCKTLDHKYVDLAIAGSDFGEQLYRTAFAFDGEIIKCGCPRNDILFETNDDLKSKIKEKIGVGENDKILLYAPTYRDESEDSEQKVNVDLEGCISILEQKTREKWVCIYRGHPAVRKLLVCEKRSDFFDLTQYNDISELLYVSDFLITDYSSCAGDFLLLNKPIIITAFDAYEYEQSQREYYMDIENVGFIVAHNQEEMKEILMTKKEEDYQKAAQIARDFYHVCENGNASEIVCGRIIDWINCM